MPSRMNFSEKLITLLPDKTLNRLVGRRSDAGLEKRANRVKNMSPAFLERISEKRLLSAFHRAANHAPHYKKFLDSRNVDVKSIKTIKDLFENVPSIDKKSYIQTSESLGDLCVDGRIYDASLLSKSSGFSGNPCIWPRSYEEEQQGRKASYIFFKYLLELSKYKTLIINSFSQGAWVAGTGLSRTLTMGVSFCVTGANGEEIIELVERCRNEYEQIVIFGYPPFLKIIIELGMSKRDDFWKNDSTRFIFIGGAEGFSEGWREYINKCLNYNNNKELSNYVYSMYGTADLGIIGFAETRTTVKIRQAAYSDTSFAKLIFGDVSRNLPMLFIYNPFQYHINVNDENELEFSTLSPNALVPLIRYNIHDLGGIIKYDEIKSKLESADIPLEIDVPAPMFYVYGRSKGEVRIASCMIYPENISDALFSDPVIAEQISGAFMIRNVENKEKNTEFFVEIELRDNVVPDDKLKSRYEEVIHNYLYKTKQGYVSVVDFISPTSKAQVIFKKQGELQNEKSIKIHYS